MASERAPPPTASARPTAARHIHASSDGFRAIVCEPPSAMALKAKKIDPGCRPPPPVADGGAGGRGGPGQPRARSAPIFLARRRRRKIWPRRSFSSKNAPKSLGEAIPQKPRLGLRLRALCSRRLLCLWPTAAAAASAMLLACQRPCGHAFGEQDDRPAARTSLRHAIAV